MKRINGSNLVEYVIPIAVIGLVVGFSLHSIFNSSYLQKFFLGSSNAKYDTSSQSSTINQNQDEKEIPLVNSSAGSLGGSPDEPVKSCVDNTCIVDFGNFVLRGIPGDFNDFVQTTGSSGGVEKVSDMLMQIAEQLSEGGNNSGSLEVRKLASLSHNMASIERSVEEMANNCSLDQSCIRSYIYYGVDENGKDINFVNQALSKPSDWDSTFISYPGDATYRDMIYNLNMGQKQSDKNSEDPKDLATFERDINKGNLSALYLQQLEKVLDNSSLNENMKNVIQELSWDVGVIGEDFQNSISFWATDGESQGLYDPITGIGDRADRPMESDISQNFQNYNASKITHFDSSLICVAGENQDTGTLCH